MPRNYILGLGGTGARGLESFLHLCAAGIGPDDAYVGFIDQDAGHANLDAAKTALQRIDQLRHWLRENQADRMTEGARPPLRTALWASDKRAHALTEHDTIAWYPAPPSAVTGNTFESIFSWRTADKDTQALMEALFHRGRADLDAKHSEHRMPLDLGFRGRPAIGAAVILARADDDADGFWKRLEDKIDEHGKDPNNPPAKVLFVSSIFGGTGAGGLPVMARRLRRVAREKAWKIDISCVMLGPYFTYAATDASLGLSANPTGFNAKLRGAFQHYARAMEFEKIFDRVYLAAWPGRFDFGGKPEADRNGGAEQKNPATLTDLLAGLAACHYFSSADAGSANGTLLYGTSIEGVRVSVDDEGRRADQVMKLTWDDLPLPSGMTRDQLRGRLATFLRFCVAYQVLFRPRLTDLAQRKPIEKEAWYRRLIAPAMKPDVQAMQMDRLRLLGEYAEGMLRWWGGIAMLESIDSDSFKDPPRALVRSGLYATRTRDEYGTTAIDVHKDFVGANPILAFRHLAHDQADQPDLADIFRTLAQASPGDDAQGLGRFVRALYDACIA